MKIRFLDMQNHFILKCRKCGVVIAQCRCADPYKEVEYTLCEDCKNKV